MVIQTTYDSCNTLVSLEEDIKNSGLRSSKFQAEEYIRTELHLPIDDDLYCYGDETATTDEPMYLPLNSRVDHYLKTVPRLINGCDELLANPARVFTKESSERVVYVAQGEVGHSLPSQCDVLVSDKATTCHILALRSNVYGNLPLTSLTHLDGTSYESCVRAMVSEHIIHHQVSSEEEKKTEDFSVDERIDLQIHIMGGFDDADSSSVKISAWLMNLLIQIAEEQKDVLKMTLETCAISSMNDNNYECPIGRGLGIDLRSGEVFLAKVDEDVAGPEVCLRAVRLWAGDDRRELSVIHSSRRKGMTIHPFYFKDFAQIDQLLRLPDHILLQNTSTSPYVEEPDFCSSIRSTLTYLRDVKCDEVFGSEIDQSLVFQRDLKSNSWTRMR
jgi:protein N-terminal asparagine amidohydrolase